MNCPFDPNTIPYQRPLPADRFYISEGVETVIREIGDVVRPEIAEIFERALPMTLDTAATVRDFEGRPDTFLITGDIPAMWPRDATNSVWAYLPLMADDPALHRLVEGVLNRETACILHDTYANSFYDFRFGTSERDRSSPEFGVHASDRTAMKPGLHERKYELDTLAAFLRLSVGFYEAGGHRPGV